MSSPNTSLKAFNTLGLTINAQTLTIAETPDAITLAWKNSQQSNLPFIVLGKGATYSFLKILAARW